MIDGDISSGTSSLPIKRHMRAIPVFSREKYVGVEAQYEEPEIRPRVRHCVLLWSCHNARKTKVPVYWTWGNWALFDVFRWVRTPQDFPYIVMRYQYKVGQHRLCRSEQRRAYFMSILRLREGWGLIRTRSCSRVWSNSALQHSELCICFRRRPHSASRPLELDLENLKLDSYVESERNDEDWQQYWSPTEAGQLSSPILSRLSD